MAKKEPPRSRECSQVNGCSFTVLCVTTEDHGVIDSRGEAVAKSRDRLEPLIRDQIEQANREMEEWIAGQACIPPCEPEIGREPASWPPTWSDTDLGSSDVQVVGRVTARADYDCF